MPSLAAAGADTITVGGPNNAILGDDGQAELQRDWRVDLLTSTGDDVPDRWRQ